MVDSRCGLHCTGCSWKESHGCVGCIETNGNPFHGECPVAVCCQNKNIIHCGQCADIPCELLTSYSCHPEHGDTPHGARIGQCKQWRIKELSPCGIDCGICPAYSKECTGCNNINGAAFWNDGKVCSIYECMSGRELKHCGQCGELPCRIIYDCKDPSISDEEHIESIRDRVAALKRR